MAELVVNFKYFFLLVKSNPPVVLLPSGANINARHTTFVTFVNAATGRTTIAELKNGTHVRFGRREKDDKKQTVKSVPGDALNDFPSSKLLLDMDDVLNGCKVVAPDPNNLTQDDRDQLNAIVQLPRGDFFPLGARNPESALVRWVLRNEDGTVRHRQLLSDLMQFDCKIDTKDNDYVIDIDGVIYDLEPGGSGDIHVSFESDDEPSSTTGLSKKYLTEYIALYSFTTGDPATMPIPEDPDVEEIIVTGSGEDRPICGGAQGDPP